MPTAPKVTPSGVLSMAGNLPAIPTDWDDYKGAIDRCPGKAFMVREMGLDALEEEEPAEAVSSE